MRLRSGVYYAFPGWPAFLTKRSTDVMISHIIRATRLRFFGHIARADPSTDHSRALTACVAPLPGDWNRQSGRPRHTWLRTVESDLAPLNIGLKLIYQTYCNMSKMFFSLSTIRKHNGPHPPLTRSKNGSRESLVNRL